MATFEFQDSSIGRVRRSAARYRLLCLPFPGAGASTFLPWGDALPADVELSAIQLGGREDRFLDEPPTTVEAIVAEVVDVVAPTLDLPYALFGHSGELCSPTSSPGRCRSQFTCSSPPNRRRRRPVPTPPSTSWTTRRSRTGFVRVVAPRRRSPRIPS